MVDDQYFRGMNMPLFRAVPPGAKRILDVGCAQGRLGQTLKQHGPAGRQVYGIERNQAAAEIAMQCLDGVYNIDVTRDLPPIEENSLDALIFGDVLEHLYDPLDVIKRLSRLLKDDGLLLCSIPNAQNHTVISALFTNDFQYKDSGLLDRDHIRFFTLSGIYKMLLDAGFLPDVIHRVMLPCSEEFFEAVKPLAEHFRIDPKQIHVPISIFQYILSASRLPKPAAAEQPMSFVACSNDNTQLQNNLAASPCFRDGRHELVVVTDASSAGDGINRGIAMARHPLVAVVHQDIYIPEGWIARLQSQWQTASQQFGPLGIAGVFGVSQQDGGPQRTGRVIDAHRLIAQPYALPAKAESLDEIVLVFPKETPIRLDPALGWHNYGTDAVLQAEALGLPAAILDAPCLHNSRFAGLKGDFVQSAQALAAKYPAPRPLHTSCIRIDAAGGMSGW
jgi:SAM-dependent methyltransferase